MHKVIEDAFERFQFLLVQLRAEGVVDPTTRYVISIPTGPIESKQTQTRHRRRSRISIPTGPIESSQIETDFEINSVFQFLLVQLRADGRWRLLVCATISIPTGPIERYTKLYPATTSAYFNSYWSN